MTHKRIVADKGMRAVFSASLKCLLLSVLLSLTFGVSIAGETNLPNFIIVFTDDQGYGDLSHEPYGSTVINTPRIDQMADEGILFTDFYAASSVCTPSRVGILTGCYPKRLSLDSIQQPGHTNYDVLHPGSDYGMHSTEITLPELLKAKNYATACVGKWNIGEQYPFGALRQGFDYYYGLLWYNDGSPPLYENDTRLEAGGTVDQSTITKRYTEKALDFITKNQDRPFFLYLPHTMPHKPVFASPDFVGSSDDGLYGDAVQEIDWSTGQILDKLKELGLDSSTLVAFTSDNGPSLYSGHGSAGPLRAGKRSTYEGGFRVPGIIRWPGTIPPGQVSSEIASIMDFYVTFAGLADIPLPADRIIDGKDLHDIITGVSGAKSLYDEFYYSSPQWGVHALRVGDWKYFENNELYNLADDIGEQNNLCSSNPTKAAEMRALLEARDAEITLNQRPIGHMDYGCMDETALNYSPIAKYDDGTCVAKKPGCRDPRYPEYDPDANLHDSSLCVSFPKVRNVTLTPPYPKPDDAVTVSAEITDNSGVTSAVLKWGTQSGNHENEVTMTEDAGVYSADIPKQAVNTTLYYIIEALDGDGYSGVTSEYQYTVETKIADWNSWDIELGTGSPQATVSGGAVTADIEFFESTDNGGVAFLSLFTTLGTTHPKGWNDVSGYWSDGVNYPYAGKNVIARSNMEPEPAGVFDLQMHPGDNNHSVVTVFIAPRDGIYKVSNLGLRRLAGSGDVSIMLADKNGDQVAAFSTTSQTWTFEGETHDLGLMTTGEQIYFAMTNVDGFAYDATEVSWTISLYDPETGSTQNTFTEGKKNYIRYVAAQQKVYFSDPERIKSVRLTRLNGQSVNVRLSENRVDMSVLNSGVWFLYVEDTDGKRLAYKVVSF